MWLLWHVELEWYEYQLGHARCTTASVFAGDLCIDWHILWREGTRYEFGDFSWTRGVCICCSEKAHAAPLPLRRFFWLSFDECVGLGFGVSFVESFGHGNAECSSRGTLSCSFMFVCASVSNERFLFDLSTWQSNWNANGWSEHDKGRKLSTLCEPMRFGCGVMEQV